MEESINDRITLLSKSKRITKKKLSEMIGIAQGSLNNMKSRGTMPSYEILYQIAKSFPDCSMDWLITGEGNMFKGDVSQSIATESIPEKDLLITMLREKDKRIEELAAENALLKKEIDTLNNIAKKRSYDNDANLPIAAEPPVELNK